MSFCEVNEPVLHLHFNTQLCLLIRVIKPFPKNEVTFPFRFSFISVGQVAPVVHAAGSCPHGSAHGLPSSVRYVLPIQVSLKRKVMVGMGYYGLDSGLDLSPPYSHMQDFFQGSYELVIWSELIL